MSEYDVKFKDNGKLKLLIVVGTRPEIIRLACVIKKCKKYFDCILAHTNQNYDYKLNQVFFEEFGLDMPDVFLNVVGQSLGETMGNVISKSYDLMKQISPDALLILGDTNSCLCAISAKRLHIPIFHMEAGNRCKDEMLPEETNRKIVDIISDVNMPYSPQAKTYLQECGIAKERIFETGSPMAEVLTDNLKKIKSSNILKKLNLKPQKYILLSAHREENIDNETKFFHLFEAINTLAEKYDMPIIYSCHPRSKKQIENRNIKLDKRVKILEPMGFFDYNNLQMNSFCVVSDSGTLPEESSFYYSINNPICAVCLRDSTERHEAMENGVFTLSGVTKEGLLQAVETALLLCKEKQIQPVPCYTQTNVSNKVVNIIQSYTNIINHSVWKKS